MHEAINTVVQIRYHYTLRCKNSKFEIEKTQISLIFIFIIYLILLSLLFLKHNLQALQCTLSFNLLSTLIVLQLRK